MVDIKDYYDAIEDILESEGVIEYSMDDLPFKRFTGGIISRVMIATLGATKGDSIRISDRGLTGRYRLSVGLIAHGNGQIDGLFRVALSELSVSINPGADVFEPQKGELFMRDLAFANKITARFVPANNGILLEVVAPDIIQTKSTRAFKRVVDVGNGYSYKCEPECEEFRIEEAPSTDSTELYKKVKRAVSEYTQSDEPFLGVEPYEIRCGDGEYTVAFTDISLVFNNPYSLQALLNLGLSGFYIAADDARVKIVLRFREN